MGIIFNRKPLTPEQLAAREKRREWFRKFFWTGVLIVTVGLVIGLAVSCKVHLL